MKAMPQGDSTAPCSTPILIELGSLRAWVNFREGKPNNLGKDGSGQLHPGLNTFQDSYNKMKEAGDTLWYRFTAIFMKDLMVIGNLCSIAICLAVLLNTINLAVTLCKRGRTELKALGWLRSLAMVFCSGPSLLQEVMQARVRTGYADLESCARNWVEVGQEAASERELEELAPIRDSWQFQNYTAA